MREPRLTFYDRVTIAPIRNYLIVGLACLLLYYLAMSANSSIAALIACAVGLGGLFLNWSGFPVVFLVLNLWMSFFPDFGMFDAQPGGRRDFERMSVLDTVNLLHHAAVLGYLIAAYRVMALADRALPSEPATVVGRLRDRSARIQDGDSPSMKAVFLTPRRPVWLVKELELVTVLMTGVGATIGGMLSYLLLNSLTKKVDFASTYDIDIAAARMLTMVWALFFGIMVLVAFFRLFSRREMTAKVARIVLLDIFYSESRREVERQQTWREWARERADRRK